MCFLSIFEINLASLSLWLVYMVVVVLVGGSGWGLPYPVCLSPHFNLIFDLPSESHLQHLTEVIRVSTVRLLSPAVFTCEVKCEVKHLSTWLPLCSVGPWRITLGNIYHRSFKTTKYSLHLISTFSSFHLL